MHNDPFSKLGALDQKLFQQPDTQPKEARKHPANTTPEKAVNRSVNQSIDQSTHQSTSQSTDQSTFSSSPSVNKVLEKPRAFYITERVNQRIDEAVRYYQEKHHIKKADRSVVVTAMLDNEANWTEEALELLLDRVLHQLTHRLTNR